MREAVVVASSRTPLAKSFRGSLNITRPDEILAHCIKDVLGKTPDLPTGELEDVIIGCGYPEGSQGMNVAMDSVETQVIHPSRNIADSQHFGAALSVLHDCFHSASMVGCALQVGCARFQPGPPPNF